VVDVAIAVGVLGQIKCMAVAVAGGQIVTGQRCGHAAAVDALGLAHRRHARELADAQRILDPR
jgi:hypothetical protein